LNNTNHPNLTASLCYEAPKAIPNDNDALQDSLEEYCACIHDFKYGDHVGMRDYTSLIVTDVEWCHLRESTKGDL